VWEYKIKKWKIPQTYLGCSRLISSWSFDCVFPITRRTYLQCLHYTTTIRTAMLLWEILLNMFIFNKKVMKVFSNTFSEPREKSAVHIEGKNNFKLSFYPIWSPNQGGPAT
jgi:hypothetical protein